MDKKLTKNDAIDILDRTIKLINSCDAKTYIILGVYGIIFIIIFTTNRFEQLSIIIINIFNKSTCFNVYFLCLFLLIASILIYIYGFFELIFTLYARIEVDIPSDEFQSDSYIYFAKIAKNINYEEYKQKLISCNSDDLLNDYISQIYINAIICDKKFKTYKMGIWSFFISIISFIFLLIFIILFE